MIRNSVKSVIGATLVLGLAMPVLAAPKAASKDATIWCPTMDESVPKAKATASVYKGKTYYFCCKMCKKMFDKNPPKNAATYDTKMAAHNKAAKKG